MCMNDPVAVGATAAARELGVKVPDDLSIMGYGARSGWLLVPPRLTTIAATATPLAEKAVRCLMRMRQESDYVAENICDPMELMIGKSTGKVRKSS